MNKKKIFALILTVLILWILLIIYFSAQDSTESYKQSGTLLRIIKTYDDILEDKNIIPYIYLKRFIKYGIFNGKFTTSTLLIRKFAHLVIYSILGGISTFVAYSYFHKVKYGVAAGIILPIGIAMLDEYIQSFVNRGSSFEDVWIDAMGALFGTFIIVTFILYRKSVKTRPKD